MLLSILIPVYNEAKTIRQIIERVQSTPYDKEIIVVDDGSSDGTTEELKQMDQNVKVLLHEKNRGKGAAIRTALQHATGDILLIQDADMEYDPSDYPQLLDPIQSGKADVVFGSRFLGGGAHRVLYFWHSLGNRFLTLLANMLNDLNMTDMETGYKAFTREVQKAIRIRSNRFGFEPEFTAKVARKRFRIYEVPVSYYGRGYREGKKITWRDGLAALFWIFRYRFFD
ncbi:glycosyltransferase family 2 protein [bacterium]|nr:glycosyltransferase family 2 protein [bacterium]MCI0601395.1 glycosyltransferase family 2 protein [bacterium]